MKALAYPFHIGLDGAFRTTEEYSQIVRGQLVDVLMTNYTERVMRPDYGSNLRSALFDPADSLARSDAASIVGQRTRQWAPRVYLQRVAFSTEENRPGVVFVDATYRATELDQTRQLRLPAATFLTEETQV